MKLQLKHLIIGLVITLAISAGLIFHVFAATLTCNAPAKKQGTVCVCNDPTTMQLSADKKTCACIDSSMKLSSDKKKCCPADATYASGQCTCPTGKQISTDQKTCVATTTTSTDRYATIPVIPAAQLAASQFSTAITKCYKTFTIPSPDNVEEAIKGSLASKAQKDAIIADKSASGICYTRLYTAPGGNATYSFDSAQSALNTASGYDRWVILSNNKLAVKKGALGLPPVPTGPYEELSSLFPQTAGQAATIPNDKDAIANAILQKLCLPACQ